MCISLVRTNISLVTELLYLNFSPALHTGSHWAYERIKTNNKQIKKWDEIWPSILLHPYRRRWWLHCLFLCFVLHFLLFLCVRFVKITLKNKTVNNKYTHKLKTKPFSSFHPYNFFQVINQNIRWFFYVGKIASSKHYFSFMYSMFIVPFMFKTGTPLDLQQQEHCLDSGLFIYF